MIDRFLIEPFSEPYMQRALLELVLLSVMGAACGLYVVLRRLAFLTEALQHTVFPGIVVAFLASQSLFLGALAAGLLTVVAFTYVSHKPAIDQNAALAVLISLFFAVGVVLVSRSGGYQHDLTTLLFGRILGVDQSQIIATAVIGLVVGCGLIALHKELMLRAFDQVGTEALGYRLVVIDLVLNLAVVLVVVAAVQAVGSVLLVAFIVTPAAAGRLASNRFLVMFAVAAGIGIVSSWLGLAASYDLSVNGGVNVAAGATVVLFITVAFVVVAGVGALSRWNARARPQGAS